MRLFSPSEFCRWLALTPLVVGCFFPALAGVERIEIVSQEPFAGGKAFGSVGAYEMIMGKLHFVLDPEHLGNQRVTDLRYAPRDERGKVRYMADFYLVRPVDSTRGNGSLLLDICNRGRPTLAGFNFPDYQIHDYSQGGGPAGDGFLMKRGFTLFGLGWQADVPEDRPDLFKLYPLRAVSGATPIRGLARSDMIFDQEAHTMPLSHWGHVPNPVADPNDSRNVLTVRDSRLGERRVIARDRWQFGRWENGAVTPGLDAIAFPEGFEKGKIYELVYVSEKPILMGLSMTAVRDAASYLRDHQESPAAVKRVLAFGGSQSGRFLRHFLYQGFHLGLDGKRVVDGVFTSVAGAGRGSFNHRFAQPSRASLPFLTFFFPTDIFPFSGVSQKDSLSGREEGLWRGDLPEETLPKVMQTNTGFEYWGRAASLIHTRVDGKADLELLSNERIYHLASFQHFPGPLPLASELDLSFAKIRTAYPMNPLCFLWCERALLMALDAWVRGDATPPPSRMPRLDNQTLMEPGKLDFPAIPGVRAPQKAYEPLLLDYGPDFHSGGIIAHQPPGPGAAYPVLVARVDADGNELGGIRLPEVAVPVATYTPWNWRHPESGAPGELADMAGAMLPFPRTRAERLASGDPRLSLEERYHSREEYIGKYAEAASKLIAEGYLLAEDLPSLIAYANKLWELAREGAP